MSISACRTLVAPEIFILKIMEIILMKFRKKELVATLSFLGKNPSVALSIFSLNIPIVLLYCATKFVNAPIEAFFLFGGLSVLVLIYAAWVVNKLMGGRKCKVQK